MSEPTEDFAAMFEGSLQAKRLETVTGQIESHVARELWRLDVFDGMVPIWSVLMNDRQRAIGVRREHVA